MQQLDEAEKANDSKKAQKLNKTINKNLQKQEDSINAYTDKTDKAYQKAYVFNSFSQVMSFSILFQIDQGQCYPTENVSVESLFLLYLLLMPVRYSDAANAHFQQWMENLHN